MLVFPELLASAAEEAGIKVPPENSLHENHWDYNEYPHFTVFCNAQLGHRMRPGAQWENARIIAAIPDNEIKEITFHQLEELGFEL